MRASIVFHQFALIVVLWIASIACSVSVWRAPPFTARHHPFQAISRHWILHNAFCTLQTEPCIPLALHTTHCSAWCCTPYTPLPNTTHTSHKSTQCSVDMKLFSGQDWRANLQYQRSFQAIPSSAKVMQSAAEMTASAHFYSILLSTTTR